MEAATLNCPMCGAASASDATACAHCGAKLATVACPSCFGMIFLGSKFCPHCGAKADRVEEAGQRQKNCPRCRVALQPLSLGWAQLDECAKCAGLWVDVETFNAICADREKQAAVLGGASPAPQPAPLDFDLDSVRYVPCPDCGTLMNRVNFSGGAGVIVDVCKGHGTWFDRDELRRIVEFIRAGGLEKSRERDREQWEAERRRRALGPVVGGVGPSPLDEMCHRDWGTNAEIIGAIGAIAAALIRAFTK